MIDVCWLRVGLLCCSHSVYRERDIIVEMEQKEAEMERKETERNRRALLALLRSHAPTRIKGNGMERKGTQVQRSFSEASKQFSRCENEIMA